MKKTLKWLLGILGAMALLLGLLWLDSVTRATRVIDAAELQLAQEIAATRNHPTAVDLIRSLHLTPVDVRALTRLPDYFDFNSATGFRLEQGLSGQYLTLRDRVYFPSGTWPTRNGSFRESLASLVLFQEAFREAGTLQSATSCYFEKQALLQYRELLCMKEVDGEDLRTMGMVLERLAKTRPTVEEILRNQKILDRIEVLHVFRSRSDPVCFVRESPCWRELFSWRILTAKSLNQIAEGRFDGDLHMNPFHFTQEESVGSPDAEARDALAMAQVATSIELFQAEMGRAPTTLGELVPNTLSELPVLRTPGSKPMSLEENFGGRWDPRARRLDLWPVLRR